MYFLKVQKKVKRADKKIEMRLVGDPAPEASQWKNPGTWVEWIDDENPRCKNLIKMWELRTGQKIESLMANGGSTVSTLAEAAAKDSGDLEEQFAGLKDNTEFQAITIEQIIEELKSNDIELSRDHTFPADGSKEFLFVALETSRKDLDAFEAKNKLDLTKSTDGK